MATYWPEFAAAGKAAITVRMTLNHTSGLPHIDEPLTADESLAWEPAVRALAAHRPQWTPGRGYLYHGQTIGWLAGEVLRRATGLSPRAFLAKEIAQPLGVRAAYGVPPDELVELAREPPLPSRDAAAYAEYVRLMHTPAYQRMLTMSGALPLPGFGSDETHNSPEVRTAELQQLVKTRLAAHAYPRRIHFVAELPKTPSGKIQRFLLRKGGAGIGATS